MFPPNQEENHLTQVIVLYIVAKTFPNPFNFVVITFSIYLRVFPEKPAACMLLSPADVIDPVWEDYADGWGDDGRVPLRKPWREWRQTKPCINLSLIYKREFGPEPNCSTVNSPSLGCVSSDNIKFLLEAAGNKQLWSKTMEGSGGGGH